MSDELEYLQPDFNPSGLKVAQLRNIFVQHDIAYPSAAKKSELLDLFERRLRPKAKRLLAQAARVKRTSFGIEDIDSREGSVINGDFETVEPEPAPRRATRKASATPSAASRTSRASRPSTRSAIEPVTDEDDEDDARTARESTARSSRRSTRTPAAESEVSESDRSRTGRRKTRLSDFDPPSQVKEEPEDDYPVATVETPFTTDNPFQSGSSPTAPSTTRRKSTTRKSQSRRRTTDSATRVKKEDDDATPVPKSRRSAGQVARLSNGKVKEDRSRTATLEPSEEFTPDEQLALEEEEELTGKAVMPARRKPRSSAAKVGPWVVLFTLLVGFTGWWRQEKLVAGYCGHVSTGRVQALSKQNIQLPEWASALQPSCDPCPNHAFCYADYEARCGKDYVLKQHPLSLGGLIPLPPTCEPDSEKVRRVKSVADRAVAELRDQKAKYECGNKDESGQTVSTPEIPEETLKAKVSAKRRRGMTAEEFEALWDGAVEDIIGREEITSVAHGRPNTTNNPALSTSSLARLPISCTIRRSARLALARHRIPLALVTAVLVLASYARYRFLAARADRARVPALVSTVLDRLATQAAIHAADRAPEPHISAGQLRDDVLRDEFSAARREQIWQRVKKVVEMNANVRAGVKEGRSGEVSRVWEWIGALPAVEDVYERSASRGRGRASWGFGEESPSGDPGVKSEDREVRRWDEGRPVY